MADISLYILDMFGHKNIDLYRDINEIAMNGLRTYVPKLTSPFSVHPHPQQPFASDILHVPVAGGTTS